MDKAKAQKLISDSIKKALDEKGMSQTDLAKKVGCDKTAISHYISGSRIPGMDILASICSELDISMDQILTGKAPVKTDDSIPTDSTAIMFSVAVLTKAGIIYYPNTNNYGNDGEYHLKNHYFVVYDFIKECATYSNSRYVNADQVINSLIGTYADDLDKAIKEEQESEELPFM